MVALLALLACGNTGDGTFWGGGKPGGGGGGLFDDTGDDGDSGDTADSGDSGDTGPVDIDCTGDAEGDVICDLVAEDASGAPWSLHAQLGQPVLLIVGHMDLASTVYTVEAIAEVEKSADILSVLLIGRDEYSTAADADDAARWLDALDADVVLLDPLDVLVDEWSDYSPPKTYVIDQTMTIDGVWYGNVEAAALLAVISG